MTHSTDVDHDDDKARARATARARRDQLAPDDRATASTAIAAAAAALLAARLPAGATVASFASKASEVDTADLDRLLRARGFRIAYPRITAGRALELALATPDELQPARFGLREPAGPAVALRDLAAFLLPGLAFDRAGNRLGWGHGHYDATLAAAPGALRVGLAFACQVVDRVPSEPHDARLHVLITETATYDVAG